MSRLLLTLTVAFGVVFTVGLWIPLKAFMAQELLALAWAESQARQVTTKPWPWADTWPVARLELPDLPAPLIVLAGTHGESLAFGPGQVVGTATPGNSGPMVIAGHRDTHFKSLQAVKINSLIRIQTRQGEWTRYRVTRLRVVDSRRELMNLAALPDDSLLLVTCYPFNSLDGGGPMRYLVEAHKVPPEEVRPIRIETMAGLADAGI
ncbi:class GN sortase [Marinobacter caseinilyticus]|uniref:class GN sortase n=1 Tax=Marinobacter caseinilyticus TaxID=2692195 RepID=UPI00140BCD64|nr:class GN sortase [Marinobacter caseinilyticus]